MSHDCATVYDIWTQHFKQPTTVDRDDPTACCHLLGYSNQLSAIPGVECYYGGEVTRLFWSSLSLTGSIPETIGNLPNLEGL
jgi:hypothetical protein